MKKGKPIKNILAYLAFFIIAIAAGIFFTEYTSNKIVVETVAVNSDINTYTSSAAPELDGKININSADKERLMTIKGIGEVRAQRIIDYREANGGFKTIENIMDVQGIGKELYESIKDNICV